MQMFQYKHWVSNSEWIFKEKTCRHHALRCDVGRHNENFLFPPKKDAPIVCLSKELSSNTIPKKRSLEESSNGAPRKL